jgi:hypothetical protein
LPNCSQPQASSQNYPAFFHSHDIAWPEVSGSKRWGWVLKATQTAGQSVHRGQDFHFMTSQTSGSQGLISTRELDASGQASSVHE